MKEFFDNWGGKLIVCLIVLVAIFSFVDGCKDFISDPLGLEEEEEEDSTYINHFVDKIFE